MITDATNDDLQTRRGEMRAAAGMYGLLARLWLKEIDVELLTTLRSQELSESLRDAGLEIPDSDEVEILDSLAADYCRIFVGPRGHFPPHQSVFSEGTFQGDLTESLNEYIGIIGKPTGEISQQTMLDHVAVELALMQRICEDGEFRDSEAEFASLSDFAGRFFTDHVRWISSYCKAVAPGAQTPFYRSLLRITHDFLAGECVRYAE